MRLGGGGLINNEEIESDAAQGIGAEGAVDHQSGAPHQVDAKFRLIGSFCPKRAGELLEAFPGDGFRLAVIWTDIPDEAAGGLCGLEHFDQGEVCFAKAAAGDENAEAGLGQVDFELALVQRKKR